MFPPTAANQPQARRRYERPLPPSSLINAYANRAASPMP